MRSNVQDSRSLEKRLIQLFPMDGFLNALNILPDQTFETERAEPLFAFRLPRGGTRSRVWCRRMHPRRRPARRVRSIPARVANSRDFPSSPSAMFRPGGLYGFDSRNQHMPREPGFHNPGDPDRLAYLPLAGDRRTPRCL